MQPGPVHYSSSTVVFVAAFYIIVAAKNLITGGKNANYRHQPEITFLASW